jgi:hypothetical protein
MTEFRGLSIDFFAITSLSSLLSCQKKRVRIVTMSDLEGVNSPNSSSLMGNFLLIIVFMGVPYEVSKGPVSMGYEPLTSSSFFLSSSSFLILSSYFIFLYSSSFIFLSSSCWSLSASTSFLQSLLLYYYFGCYFFL